MSRDDSDSISISSASVTNNTNITLQNHFPPVPSLETQKQFEKMLSFIRPGVKIPTAEIIGGKNLLDTYTPEFITLGVIHGLIPMGIMRNEQSELGITNVISNKESQKYVMS